MKQSKIGAEPAFVVYNEKNSCSEKKGTPADIIDANSICVDTCIIGPLLETEDSCKYVLVASDCFTR